MLVTGFIISFITIAIHIIFTWKGMLLYKVGKWLQLRLPTYVKKPLFDCPMCMASFWTLVYWLYKYQSVSVQTLIMMFIVCGINTLLSSAIYYFHEEPEDDIFSPIENQIEFDECRKQCYGLFHAKHILSDDENKQLTILRKKLTEYNLRNDLQRSVDI